MKHLLVVLLFGVGCGTNPDCKEAVNHMYEIVQAEVARVEKSPPELREKIATATAEELVAIAADRKTALARCDKNRMTQENHDCLMRATNVDETIRCGGFK